MNTVRIVKAERSLIGQDWYDLLIEDCKATVVEGVFNARQELLRCYHDLGTRILKEKANFDRSGVYGQEIVQRIAESMDKSSRTIYYAIQFASAFSSLDALPEGKNISWTKVIKLLSKKEEGGFECTHDEQVEIVIRKCKCCREVLSKEKVNRLK